MISNEYDEHEFSSSEPGDDAAGMPNGVGEHASDGFGSFEPTSAARRHASGALLLVAVVLVAIGGLFSMRTLTKASAATSQPSDIEKSIESFLKDSPGERVNLMARGDTAVLSILNESYTARQVPLANVQRNPFIIFEQTEVATPRGPRQAEPVDPRIEARRVRTMQIEQASGQLRLRSVLMGSDPLANINNQILRAGESITVQPNDVVFRVQWIDAESVGLIAEDSSLDLSVGLTLQLRRNR